MPAKPPASDTGPPHAGRVAFNMACLVLTLALLSGWVLYYTDWFPVLAGLFTLSGVFAWLAFLSNLVTDERAAQWRDALDTRVLQARRTPAVLLAVLVVFVLVFPVSRGTLVLDAMHDDSVRTVEVRAGSDDAKRILRRASVSPGGARKLSLWVPPFSSREVIVKAAGLPWRRAEVAALTRTVLDLPEGFRKRAVLLVRPEADDVATLALQPERYVLEIELGEDRLEVTPYGGEALLIGAEADIELPRALVDAWRFQFVAAGVSPLAVARWTNPRAVRPDAPLPAGQVVSARLRLGEGGTPSPVARAMIAESGRASTFPIELVVARD